MGSFQLRYFTVNRLLEQMTVFRSKTFKKRPSRKSRKTLRRKTVRSRKQSGGYLPYRAIPKGAVFADVLDWDDQKEQKTQA
jgi:hypothetical protein